MSRKRTTAANTGAVSIDVTITPSDGREVVTACDMNGEPMKIEAAIYQYRVGAMPGSLRVTNGSVATTYINDQVALRASQDAARFGLRAAELEDIIDEAQSYFIARVAHYLTNAFGYRDEINARIAKSFSNFWSH